MNHLIIDSGNTLAKVAIFRHNEIISQASGPHNDWTFLFQLLHDHPPLQGIMISDVSDSTRHIVDTLSKLAPVMYMHAGIGTPLTIDYQTPETLGSDRLAAAVAAYTLFPGKPLLVIQMGTCITYEFVSADAKYQGGAISPGLDMRFKAMHTFTARLPLVKKEEIDFIVGKNTCQAILSGVINGCIAEIDGIIDEYRNRYEQLQVVVGGGDTFFFDKKLKNRIFATENLVLRGLNEVLKFNHVDFEK